MDKQLIMTVGLPRSGKSTWSKEQGYPIVNLDSIRLALHGHAFIRRAEPMVGATARIMVPALFEAGHDIVILDSTAIYEGLRKSWCDIPDREVNDGVPRWTVKYRHFDTSESVCIDRAVASNRKDLIPIIKQMAEKFEPLTEEEQLNCYW